jgi:type IV secretory pathway TraG/TraD family ATPase VirD4
LCSLNYVDPKFLENKLGFKMKKFIFRYLLIMSAIAAITIAVATPAQAKAQPDNLVPSWVNPQSVITMSLLAIGGYFVLRPGKKRDLMASARWARDQEKVAAGKIAIKQINERKRDGLTTWINTPIITPLTKPQERDGKIVKRYNIKPQDNTIFIPDGQRGTTVCGAPGSGKTFSVIDPMIRSVIDQGFPICLYDFKFPGGQAEIHAAYARNRGYDVRIFAPGFEGTESCNLLDFLKSADDSETAGQIAKVLNSNFSLNGGKGGEDPFFQLSGDQLIKAVLQLAKLSEFPDFLTCQKILALDSTDLIDRVKAADISPWVRTSWDQFMSMRESEKTAASVAAIASLMFTNFVSPDILPCLCGESTIPLDLEGKQMIIFGMDQNRRDIIGPILATVLHMVVTRNIAKKRVDPLAVFLDELPTLSLPSLVNWLNESRSAGFCGVLGYQNMTQLEKAYGKENSRAILSGCNTKFIFNPGEYESAKYFSDYLGDEEVHYRQKSRSSSKDGGSTSSSEQDKTKKIFLPEEFLKLPAGDCIFINPAYSNDKEASIPVKLKVEVGDGEIQRRAYGEKNFHIVIKKLKKQNKSTRIEASDVTKRIDGLEKLIPKASEKDNQESASIFTKIGTQLMNQNPIPPTDTEKKSQETVSIFAKIGSQLLN